MLLDLAAGWAVGIAIGDYPRFAATEGFRWVLAIGLGLLAIAFVVAVARLAGRPVAYLLASVLLGINLFQAVASLAWRLGSAFSSMDDVLGLTQYSGEAVALAIAMVIVYRTSGLRED